MAFGSQSDIRYPVPREHNAQSSSVPPSPGQPSPYSHSYPPPPTPQSAPYYQDRPSSQHYPPPPEPSPKRDSYPEYPEYRRPSSSSYATPQTAPPSTSHSNGDSDKGEPSRALQLPTLSSPADRSDKSNTLPPLSRIMIQPENGILEPALPGERSSFPYGSQAQTGKKRDFDQFRQYTASVLHPQPFKNHQRQSEDHAALGRFNSYDALVWRRSDGAIHSAPIDE